MTVEIIIKPKAEDEMRAAAEWYEARRPALGFEFLEQVDVVFERIQENPRQLRFYEDSVRIVHLRRFPFGVFYEVEDDKAFIISVMRLSRREDRWKTG